MIKKTFLCNIEVNSSTESHHFNKQNGTQSGRMLCLLQAAVRPTLNSVQEEMRVRLLLFRISPVQSTHLLLSTGKDAYPTIVIAATTFTDLQLYPKSAEADNLGKVLLCLTIFSFIVLNILETTKIVLF